MLDNIRFLIKKYDLDTTSRLREKAYRRFFMYDQLYPMMTLSKIGELFNRDHSTVLKGIQEARNFASANDKYYLDMVRDIRHDLIGTGTDDDVQRTAAGVFKNMHDILTKTQDDPFDDVAWEISITVVEMIIGTQKGHHATFWKCVRERMKEKMNQGCNIFEKDTLS